MQLLRIKLDAKDVLHISKKLLATKYENVTIISSSKSDRFQIDTKENGDLVIKEITEIILPIGAYLCALLWMKSPINESTIKDSLVRLKPTKPVLSFTDELFKLLEKHDYSRLNGYFFKKIINNTYEVKLHKSEFTKTPIRMTIIFNSKNGESEISIKIYEFGNKSSMIRTK